MEQREEGKSNDWLRCKKLCQIRVFFLKKYPQKCSLLKKIVIELACKIMFTEDWLRKQDLNLWPSGYEPDELPSCSIPRCLCCGWGYRIRTCEYRYQKPRPYRLATPQCIFKSFFNGSEYWIRTSGQVINSHLLYRWANSEYFCLVVDREGFEKSLPILID